MNAGLTFASAVVVVWADAVLLAVNEARLDSKCRFKKCHSQISRKFL